MKTSLISVTFRNKTVEEVAEIARKGGLEAVEWGGDKHVKPGGGRPRGYLLQPCQQGLRRKRSFRFRLRLLLPLQ